MWIVSDTGILINLEAVRSVGLDISDDRQYVEVQVRWNHGGERFAVVSLIVQDYGGVKPAMESAQKIVDALEKELTGRGQVFLLPVVPPPEK